MSYAYSINNPFNIDAIKSILKEELKEYSQDNSEEALKLIISMLTSIKADIDSKIKLLKSMSPDNGSGRKKGIEDFVSISQEGLFSFKVYMIKTYKLDDLRISSI